LFKFFYGGIYKHMGLVIKIKNIQSANNFKLFYRVGRTPGSSFEQSSLTWGTQYMGSPSVGGIFNESVTTISIDLMTQGIANGGYYDDSTNPYGKQYWFKILDLVTNSFIIENIYIHDKNFYNDYCHIQPTPTPTATPTATATPTSTPTSTPTITPTSTNTPTITFTPTITPTSANCNFEVIVELTNSTPTSTPTLTPTLTPTPTGGSPSFGISVSPSEASDGGGAYGATVTAANISFPQTYYITILSTVGTVNLNDFQNNFPSTITLSSSGQEYFFSLAEDQLTEGTEKFKLELRSGSSSGTILATSNEVTILDTSLSLYYYTLVPCAGGTNLYSTGIPQGTFSSGDIVEGATETYYVIGGSTTTDPGGTKITVTASTLEECPAGPPPITYRTAYVTAWTRDAVDLTTIKSEVCGVNEQQISINLGYTQLNSGNLYVNETSITSGTTYQLYTGNVTTDGTTPDGAGKWYAIKIQGVSGNFTMIASINSSGIIQDWTPCTTSSPAPSTSATYLTSLGTRWVCNGPNVPSVLQYDIYQNTNQNFTGNQFSNGTGGTQTFASISSMLTSAPSTEPILASQPEGPAFCSYGVQRFNYLDTNPCSTTFGSYISVLTGDNSSCWVLGPVYYDSCENAQSGNYPVQSFIQNGVHKWKHYVAPPIYEEYEVGGITMTGEWFTIIDSVAKRRVFSGSGVILSTDTEACVVNTGGGGTGGGGGGELEPG
jgi:hypothetical protein